jgi:hypothetical protein
VIWCKSGKKAHATKQIARAFADYWWDMRPNERMDIYRCRMCKAWHLTTVTLIDRIVELMGCDKRWK